LATATDNLPDIDFLPRSYRQRYEKRRARSWHSVVVVGLGLLLCVASVGQYRIRRNLESEMQSVSTEYDAAVVQSAEVAARRLELLEARTVADLYTYLRHPWPRTQILTRIVGRVPDSITLTSVAIALESEATLDQSPFGPFDPANPDGGPSPTSPEGTLAPAAQALERLRREFEVAETTVRLEGVALENRDLHSFLDALASDDLFVDVELESVDSRDRLGADGSEFRIHLVVRPGYGLPGGPVPLTSEQAVTRPQRDEGPIR